MFKTISHFLKRFEYLAPPELSIEKESEDILKKFYIDSCSVKCRNRTLFISIKNPVQKSDVFVRQNSILEELKSRFKGRAPEKIQFLNS